jgi:uncharacterized surface protein with fasciclin (FAS1) repeats
MKNIILTLVGFIIIMLCHTSCSKPTPEDASFKDTDKYSIYTYLVAHKDSFSSFLSIVDTSKLKTVLSTYNTTINTSGYTLFLPDNNAIDKFIRESGGKYTSLDDLLKDTVFASELCRYHVLSEMYKTDAFPYGYFDKPTLSNDQLAVNIPENSVYFFINNQAPVVRSNIKVSNGYIHVIRGVLKPITYTTYNWLEQNSNYSIFKSVVDITGLKATLNFNRKTNPDGSQFTLLVEPDSVYNKRNIYTLADLENLISPNNTDYTNPSNPLNKFVLYHLLEGSMGLMDFAKKSGDKHDDINYDTYSEIPLRIKYSGSICQINQGSTIFDTIVSGKNLITIDYIGFNLDASNVLTQSGSVNIIDQILQQVLPQTTGVHFPLYSKEPVLQKMRNTEGYHLIDDSATLKTIKWTGSDMYYYLSWNWNGSRDNDYLEIDKGDFTITITTSKIVPGKYSVRLWAGVNNPNYAFVQVYIDEVNIGGIVDLTSKGDSDWFPVINSRELGKINFSSLEQHKIVIKSVIPGIFLFDAIEFQPSVQ